MLKRLGLLLPVVLCTLPAGLQAADFAALKPQGYVSDFAEVVDQGSREQINAYCARVEQTTGAEIALVTLRTTEGEPVEDVANLLYRKWGVGQKKTNEGVLVLLVVNDRRSRIEVGYGLEPVITDGYVGGLLRSLRPSLRSGDYAQALADAAHQLGEKIAAAKGVAIGAQAPRRSTRPQPEGLPLRPLVMAGLIFLLFLFTRGRGAASAYGGGFSGFLTGMLIGNLLGGAGGPRTRGGGGFGGFDSGDSFGGFGGGDSGGGGASSDW
ncbi:MAG: TPM domain-containing protein [Bryobacteraceae bacterium]